MVLRRPAGVGDGVGCGRWAKRPPPPTIPCDQWGRLRLGLYTLLPAMVGGERFNERGILNSNNTMVLDTALVNEHGSYLSCGRADVVVRLPVISAPRQHQWLRHAVWPPPCPSTRGPPIPPPGVGDQHTLADCGAIHLGLQQKSKVSTVSFTPPLQLSNSKYTIPISILLAHLTTPALCSCVSGNT